MSTIKDVAEIAGVSAATVSHVVNKTRYVSPELVKRVQDAINSLEYPPNFVVKRYRNSTTKADNKYIALIASNIHNPFQKDVQKCMASALEKKGYILVPFDYSENSEVLELFSDLIAQEANFHGAVVFPGNDNEEFFISLESA